MRPVVSTDAGDVRHVTSGARAVPSCARRRPLRVLVLRQGYFPDDPRVRREVGALAARGHAVDIVCLRAPGQSAREHVGGARVLRLPLGHRRGAAGRYAWEYGAFGLTAAVVALAMQVQRRYDVVQVNTLPDALVFAAVGPRLAGARVLLDLHEAMPELYASQAGVGADHPVVRLLARIEQAAIRFADACLVVSEPCRAVFVRRGAPAGKLTVVMNSPDPALFTVPDGDVAAGLLRRAPGEPVRVVSHGTLVERYGYDGLVRAVAAIGERADAPPVSLEIIGAGEARVGLERLVEALGIQDRVTFTGHVPLDHVPARLAGAAVGVVANRSDPFTDLVVPTKLMEYAALGIPAVAARTPAVAAHFDAGVVRFFEPGDPEGLADALADVIADPHAARERADRARDDVETHYGWPTMADRYAAVVERLAPGRGR